jgi:aminopeptidase N
MKPLFRLKPQAGGGAGTRASLVGAALARLAPLLGLRLARYEVARSLPLSLLLCLPLLPLLLLLPIAAQAAGNGHEAPFSFDKTPGKLPKSVIPLEYSLLLQPDLEQHMFKGDLTVDIKVIKPVRQIVLNAVDLSIVRATLLGENGVAQALQAKLDPAQETVSFTLAQTLPQILPVGQYRLQLAYRGKITRQPYGLYYDLYPTPSGEKQILATELEPTEARRMLPCWDEPAFRAHFQISIDLPSHFKAYSNTQAAAPEPVPGSNWLRHRFGRTPKMPSYLLVLAAGEFERSVVMQDGVEIGVVTTEGKQGGAPYALSASRRLLRYFNQYFAVPYPLPKLDHIGVPHGFGGAMENWGGIIYTETNLLYEPGKDGPNQQRKIFSVAAHEMAHQWFGNLVTMAWWDNLWLNEGFASWMGSKAMAELNPEWTVALDEHGERDDAMAQDALPQTHAIWQEIKNEAEANDAFDGITYAKGQAFLRMLEQYLGPAEFQQGIRAYLKQHQYSNTTSADLWQALTKASGKPVAPLARAWITQPGFPLISVEQSCRDGVRQIELSQQQFGEAGPGVGKQLWPVPVQFKLGDLPIDTVLLTGKRTQLQRPGCDALLLLDPNDIGFYRVRYAEPLRAKIEQGWAQLPDTARARLLSDSWALVGQGQLPLKHYMAWVARVAQADGNSHPLLWEQVFGVLAEIRAMGRTEAWYPAWQRYWFGLLSPHFERLGWAERADESEQVRQLRANLIGVLATLDQPTFIDEGKQRFLRSLTEKSTMSAALQDALLLLAARHADPAIYDQLKQLQQQAQTTAERSRYYYAMSRVKDPQLAQQTLNLLFDPDLQLLDFSAILQTVAGSEHLDLAWRFVQQHHVKLGKNQTVRDRNRLAPNVLNSASEQRYAEQLDRFAKTQLAPEARADAQRVSEAIRLRVRKKGLLLPQLQSLL